MFCPQLQLNTTTARQEGAQQHHGGVPEVSKVWGSLQVPSVTRAVSRAKPAPRSQEGVLLLAVAARGCAQEGSPPHLSRCSPFEVGLCLEGRTHQTNILSWSQNILLLPLVLGVKGWIRCKGQLDAFHFSAGSWICVEQRQVQERASMSSSGWD